MYKPNCLPTDAIQSFYSSHFIRLSLLLMKHADQMLGSKYNLTHSQFSILFILLQCGEQSQSDLAQKLNLTGAAISRLVNTLAEKDYLTREENPENRRENILQLTKVGRDTVTQAVKNLMEMEKKLYGHLDQSELDTTMATVEHLTLVLQ